MGFDKEPFESLVKMSIFKITPEFVAEVRKRRTNGSSDGRRGEAKNLSRSTPEYIRRAKADGVPMKLKS
jgi:hypothetical protein